MVGLKLVYRDDVRKTHIDCLSISSLHDTIRSLYSDLECVAFDNLYLYYVDDENDKIRIKFDNELCEALRFTNEKGLLLKIFIQKQSAPTATKCDLATDFTKIDPILGLVNGMAPLVLNNPVAMQQMTSMLPAMLPLVSSFFGQNAFGSNVNMSSAAQAQTTSTSTSTASQSADWGCAPNREQFCDSSVSVSPVYASVSTNTLIDAKDASTETLTGIAQTTQTQQPNSNAHRTTQTGYNASCATQTAQGKSATQTTQTYQNESCATQTTLGPNASQTTQTQPNTQTTNDTQILEDTLDNFYASLAKTQFGNLLEQLQELGFTDKEKCVQALVKNGGKLPEAIDELLLDS